MEETATDPRVLVRRPGPPDPRGTAVVLWMQRAQRAADNPALDVAVAAANSLGLPVTALFVLRNSWPRANARHYRFMLDGLAELPSALAERGVGFALRAGGEDEVARSCAAARPALLVGDENPIREAESWRRRVADEVAVPFWTVDADVVVPSSLLGKEQFSAGTIRPRLRRHLPWFLVASKEERPAVRSRAPLPPPPATMLDGLEADRRAAPVEGWEGGRRAGLARLRRFLRDGLPGYASSRNRPDRDGTSRLSPYLHFGQLGPREIALAVEASGAPAEDRASFLDELLVRRELAWNFVRFNPRYDSLAACEPWALKTLDAHREDERDRLYGLPELEAADTHDPLWNAAQRQMLRTGWMHGYLRMYWAKKILEWSASPEEAMAHAIELNDRYLLDGRDPNGYAGIAWAICGKHDRAWGPERPIYGKVRYMSYAGTSRKFDSRAYIGRWNEREDVEGKP